MEQIKKLSPHLIVILLFVGISFAYFSPVMQGKMIDMPDIKHWKGMSKEVQDFREDTGEEALWTNSMFSGMPAYQISTKSNGNLIQYVAKSLSLGIPRPANLLFLYLLGFYLLLLSLKVDYRVSVVGAIAFAFSSYFFIIIEAGHMTKAHAIAYVPMVVAAVLYTYRGKMLLGGALTALTVALELYANHLQITYYLVLILVLIGIVQFVKDLKANNLTSFAKRSGVLILAALLASGTAMTRLSTTMEYGKESTRGKSELTTNLDNKTSGLDKDYATSWSYGIAESFTLLIPNFYGGASQGELTTESETYNELKKITKDPKKIIRQLPLYWGAQPFTSGPTYAGSIVIFLFVLGLFFVKSKMRIWLLLATILSLMLAWGKNLMFLTEFFLDYFPGYNKFRAVSMILVIAEFTIPVLGFVALNKFLTSDISANKKKKPLLLAFYIVGGLSLIFALIPSLFFDFVGSQDANLEKNGWPIDALQSDRAGILGADAWRSFIFIALAFGTMLIFLKTKMNSKFIILIIGVLVLADMFVIDKRYLDAHSCKHKYCGEITSRTYLKDPLTGHFKKKEWLKPEKKQYNADILKDTDPNFRVFNQSVSTFNDASTSYFHKSIGGYHGAKLKRYQELIENHIAKGNMAVLNMLNTKYFITPKGQAEPNSGAMGNAWFVDDINIVPNADAEIAALNGFNPATTAIVDARFSQQMIVGDEWFGLDNTEANNIVLTEYKPNYLKYNATASKNGIAIFSEIYYDKGWNAYVDGELKPHFRANYVLRGMQIPAGNHVVEFKFEPAVYDVSERIALASSIILLLLLAFVSVKELKA